MVELIRAYINSRCSNRNVKNNRFYLAHANTIFFVHFGSLILKRKELLPDLPQPPSSSRTSSNQQTSDSSNNQFDKANIDTTTSEPRVSTTEHQITLKNAPETRVLSKNTSVFSKG